VYERVCQRQPILALMKLEIHILGISNKILSLTDQDAKPGFIIPLLGRTIG